MYYAAYGLNADEGRMMEVCPTARRVDFGMIFNWLLRFIPEATIVNTGDGIDFVPVVVWEIDESDVTAITTAENIDSRRVKTIVKVELGEPIAREASEDNTLFILKREVVDAIVYAPENKEIACETKGQIPEFSYYETIRRAFRHNTRFVKLIEHAYLDSIEEILRTHEKPGKFDYFCLSCMKPVTSCICGIIGCEPAYRFMESEFQDIFTKCLERDRYLVRWHRATNEDDYTFAIITPYDQEDNGVKVPDGYQLIEFDRCSGENSHYFMLISKGKSDLSSLVEYVDSLPVSRDGYDVSANDAGKRWPIWELCTPL